MPGIARVNADSAGGTITQALAPSVYVNGNRVAVINCQVASHGTAPHNSPVMVGASGNVYAESKRVCRQGDAASCGHAASGSGNVFANG